jgi:spherulation-specific family 4 protein
VSRQRDHRVGDLDLLAPAYVHPLDDPGAWDRLVALAPVLRAVVVNVHNGPGEEEDAAYTKVLERLADARVRVVGYVDTDYGRRPAGKITADVDTWLSRYGVHGVFLDQVASGLDLLDHYAEVTVAVRARGADYVVLNPGTSPHPGYLDLANVTVTFEGPWSDYRRMREPERILSVPASRFAHLVHGVPYAAAVHAALRLAGQRHVRTVYVTTGTGPNPWNLVPRPLLDIFGLDQI